MQRPGSAGLSGLCKVTEHLYVSNGRAAGCAPLLTGNRITCVINVTESSGGAAGGAAAPPGLERIHIPVSDSPDAPLSDHFDRVADQIQRVSELGGRTLVHCNAGVSRSVALCMAFLLKHRGVSLLEAHAWLRGCRPVARPNPGFWRQLIRYEERLRGRASVRMVASSMGEIPDVYEEESRNMVPL